MYALVDCNNFYVSCERVFQPQYNGKPVVVLSNNDGCIISRSYEAKEIGIPNALASLERAITQPSLLESITTGFPIK